MEQFEIFVGIDIAKKDFSVSLYIPGKGSVKAPCKYLNRANGIEKCLEWLERKHPGKTIFCLEDTGSYSEIVTTTLSNLQHSVWVEHPLRIKASFGTDLGKDDDLDAKRIAEYAWRYQDRFKPYEAPSPEVEELRALMSVRQVLVRERVAHTNELKDMKLRAYQPSRAIEILEQAIKDLKRKEQEIRKKMEELLPTENTEGQVCTCVRSIPGVGLIMTASLAIYTNGFRKEPDGRKLAAYMGVCPRTHESGSSIKRRPRSTGYGPSSLRALFFLACGIIKQRPGALRSYAMRKEAEGKPKMVVMNNLRNKLAHLICAIIRTKKQFIGNYISIEPRLSLKFA